MAHSAGVVNDAVVASHAWYAIERAKQDQRHPKWPLADASLRAASDDSHRICLRLKWLFEVKAGSTFGGMPPAMRKVWYKHTCDKAKGAKDKVPQVDWTSIQGRAAHVTGVCGKDGYKCVISYGLYGAKRKYITGMLKNAQLAHIVYPGWTVRIYTDGSVPDSDMNDLAELGVEAVFVNGASRKSGATRGDGSDDGVAADNIKGGIAGMFWRFLVAGDDTVDRWIIRDTDSRLNVRAKHCVDEWMQTDYAIHTIRDHPNHSRGINGGMFGGIKGVLRGIEKKMGGGNVFTYGGDLTFLRDYVWEFVKEDQLGHDSYTCHKWPNSRPFPDRRNDEFEHVGQVFYADDTFRKGDITCCMIGKEVPMQCRGKPEWIYG
jgi:hypothetical protein